MPLPLPNLDNRTYADLVEEARSLIPSEYGTWTNYNPTDPGIILTEMLAWLTEIVLFRVDQVPDRNIEAFLQLLNGPDWQPQGTLEDAIRETIQALRKQYRAVSAEDFEHLVLDDWPQTLAAQKLGAVSKIARVRCLPGLNLELKDSVARLLQRPGHVSLVVIPQREEPEVNLAEVPLDDSLVTEESPPLQSEPPAPEPLLSETEATESVLINPEAVLEFSGSQKYLELPPNSLPTGDQITISFWAYLENANENVVIKAAGEQQSCLLLFEMPDNYCFDFYCGGRSDYIRQVVSESSFDGGATTGGYDGQWLHWTLTKDSAKGELKIYLNGELWSSRFDTTDSIAEANQFYVGGSDSVFDDCYAKISELRIWNRVRMQTAIQTDMYRRLTGNEDGLVAYWPLNENEGNIVHDRSPNGHDGTLHGAQWVEVESFFASPDPELETTGPLEGMAQSLVTSNATLLAFDGVEDWSSYHFIELPPASLPTGNQITISFWVYFESLDNDNTILLAGVMDENNRNILTKTLTIEFLSYSNSVRFSCGSDSLTKTLESTSSDNNESGNFYNQRWLHFALTKNTTDREMTVYLNGEVWINSTNLTANIPEANRFRLGGSLKRWDRGLRCHAKISELCIWNKARGQSEIQADMNRRLTGDENSLVAYWPLNEGAGNIAFDRTPYGHHGTIYGTQWVTLEDLVFSNSLSGEISGEQANSISDSETVLQFEGESYLDLGDGVAVGPEFTQEAWIYPRIINKKTHPILGYQPSSDAGERAPSLMVRNRTRIAAGFGNGDHWVDCELSPSVLELDAWNYVAVTFDGEDYKIYVNDEGPFETATQPDELPTETPIKHIGRLDDWYFMGSIAEVRIWNRVRPENELTLTRHQRLIGNEPGLVGYWPLNEGNGTQAFDHSPNKNHGTLHGAHGAEWVNTSELSFQGTISIPEPVVETSDLPAAVTPESVSVPEIHDPILPQPIQTSPQASLHQALWNYLDDRRLLTTRHHVVAPDYVPVQITATLYLLPGALPNLVQNQAVKNVRQLFDPLQGGGEGQGWPFGRAVYRSEVYELLDNVDGVDYVQAVVLQNDPSLKQVMLKDHELVTVEVDENSFLIEQN